jgi:hypothetical protein
MLRHMDVVMRVAASVAALVLVAGCASSGDDELQAGQGVPAGTAERFRAEADVHGAVESERGCDVTTTGEMLAAERRQQVETGAPINGWLVESARETRVYRCVYEGQFEDDAGRVAVWEAADAGAGGPRPALTFELRAGPAPAASVIAASGGRTGPIGEDSRASCVHMYGPAALSERAFAFDGTVKVIDAGSTNKPGQGHLDTVAVTFAVNEWFKGGAAPTVTVDLMAPGSHSLDGEPPAYEEGTRLLVSGEPRWGGEPLDDPIAWTCGGWTRYHEQTVAEEWRRATA